MAIQPISLNPLIMDSTGFLGCVTWQPSGYKSRTIITMLPATQSHHVSLDINTLFVEGETWKVLIHSIFALKVYYLLKGVWKEPYFGYLGVINMDYSLAKSLPPHADSVSDLLI